jgi:hypothetical protein
MKAKLITVLDSVIERLGCRKQLLKRWGVPGYSGTYNEDGLFTNHNCDFVNDDSFQHAYNLGFGTGSTQGWHIRWRIHTLLWAASIAKHLSGDFIECGTYLGASAMAVVDHVDFNKTCKNFYLCDTFTGLPDHAEIPHDYSKKNYYEEVAATFRHFPQVKLAKGLIPDSLEHLNLTDLSLINIDCGMEDAEAPALRYLWRFLVKGGIVVLNCYAYPGFANIKSQYDAFAKEKGLFIFTCPTGQGLIVKG